MYWREILILLTVWTTIFSFPTEHDWWEVQKTDDGIFDEDSHHTTIRLRRIDGDDMLIHSCYEYVVDRIGSDRVKSGRFCYPSIIITGVRKCSTSAMYGLLAKMRGSVTLVAKENCPYLGFYRSIVSYFDSMPDYIPPGHFLIDGCVDSVGNMKMREILRGPNTFYVLIIRDFSDWIWSAYNYWCSTSYDLNCDRSSYWALPEVHNRSAREFHHIVESSQKGRPVNSPLGFSNLCEKASVFYQTYHRRLRNGGVSPDGYTIFTSEELEGDSVSVWERLTVKAGLLSTHDGLGEFKKYRYNVQTIQADVRRGDHPELSTIAAEKHRSGLYPISNNEPLMDKTRAILNDCWKDDCLWARNATGHPYNACAVSSSDVENTSKVSMSRVSKQVKNDSTAQFPGYLNKNIRECSQNRSQRSFQTSQYRTIIVTHNRSISSLVGRLLMSALDSPAVYILSNPSNLSNNCETYRNAETVIVAAEDLLDLKLHEAQMNTTRSIAMRLNYPVGVNKSQTTCPTAHYLFDRVVVVQDDSLLQVWKQFLSDHDIDAAAYDGCRVNWTKWDETAARIVTEDVLSKSLRGFKNATSTNTLFLQSEFLFSGQGKVSNLIALLNFMGHGNSPLSATYLRCAHVLWMAALRDSGEIFSLFKEFVSMKENYLAWIYSSDATVCKKKARMMATAHEAMVVQTGSFYPQVRCPSNVRKPSAHMTANTTSARYQHQKHEQLLHQKQLHQLQLQLHQQQHNQHFSSPRTCRLRYNFRGYLDLSDRRVPPALVSLPSREANSLRLLVEFATGYLTASTKTDISVSHLFPAEMKCGQRMSLLFAEPRDLSIKQSLNRPPYAALNSAAKRKCRSGLVRDFTRFILLVHDPIFSIWSQFSNRTKNLLHSSTHEHNDQESGAHILKNISRAVDLETVFGDDESTLKILSVVPREQILIMTYEYLVYRETYSIAMDKVVEFLNIPRVSKTMSEESRQCARTLFIPSHQVHPVSAAVKALKHHQKYLCTIKRALEEHIPATYLSMSIFATANCSHTHRAPTAQHLLSY